MPKPTLYEPRFCDLVVELGKQGKSVTQMACECGVHRDTLYDWCKFHPEFKHALDMARQWSQYWWENKGQEGMETGNVNAALWSRSMAARFPEDYTERQKRELSGANGSPLLPSRMEIVLVEPG